MTVREKNNLDFLNLLNNLPDQEYLLSIIAYGAAPTIREEKPSSLMTFTKNKRNLYDLWKTLKLDVCSKLNLEFVQLRDKQASVRVLFYRRKLLDEHINRNSCRVFLNKMGYSEAMTLDECINKLKLRFEHICPHEIGVFLGIPVEDVVGFIRHKGENSLLCSYWKVYHNPHLARILFECYDKAREDVRESIKDKYEHNLVVSA